MSKQTEQVVHTETTGYVRAANVLITSYTENLINILPVMGRKLAKALDILKQIHPPLIDVDNKTLGSATSSIADAIRLAVQTAEADKFLELNQIINDTWKELNKLSMELKRIRKEVTSLCSRPEHHERLMLMHKMLNHLDNATIPLHRISLELQTRRFDWNALCYHDRPYRSEETEEYPSDAEELNEVVMRLAAILASPNFALYSPPAE